MLTSSTATAGERVTHFSRTIFVVGVLSASVLAGCGSNAANTPTPDTVTSNQTQAILNDPNVSAAEKQKAAQNIQTNPKLSESQKLNAMRGVEAK